MIGAIVLFEVAAAAASSAPRAPVSAEPTDLSTVASRIQINKKALDGWVPAKGTPAPLAPLPDVVYVPERDERRTRREAPEVAQNEMSPYEEESVNSFTGDRPWFYGNWPPLPPRGGHHPGGGGGGRPPQRPHPEPHGGPSASPAPHAPATSAAQAPAPRVTAGRTGGGPARRGML